MTVPSGPSLRHPSSVIQTTDIGSGTETWQLCVVLSGASIGEIARGSRPFCWIA
jgi:hypothetical protein